MNRPNARATVKHHNGSGGPERQELGTHDPPSVYDHERFSTAWLDQAVWASLSQSCCWSRGAGKPPCFMTTDHHLPEASVRARAPGAVAGGAVAPTCALVAAVACVATTLVITVVACHNANAHVGCKAPLAEQDCTTQAPHLAMPAHVPCAAPTRGFQPRGAPAIAAHWWLQHAATPPPRGAPASTAAAAAAMPTPTMLHCDVALMIVSAHRLPLRRRRRSVASAASAGHLVRPVCNWENSKHVWHECAKIWCPPAKEYSDP